MSKIKLTRILNMESAQIAYFKCPGCNDIHGPNVGLTSEHDPVAWEFNGDIDKPTFSPSLLIKSGHYASAYTGTCWCTYNAENPDEPAPFECVVCHSFVRDGMIQFLSHSTHHLSGQTVPIPEWDEN